MECCDAPIVFFLLPLFLRPCAETVIAIASENLSAKATGVQAVRTAWPVELIPIPDFDFGFDWDKFGRSHRQQ